MAPTATPSSHVQTMESNELASAGPEPATKKRRQYHACDRCRRGRRACDAQKTSAEDCSNCVKLGRQCTFDWLREIPEPQRKKRKPVANERPPLNSTLFTNPIAYLDSSNSNSPLAYGYVAPSALSGPQIYPPRDASLLVPGVEEIIENTPQFLTPETLNESISPDATLPISPPGESRRRSSMYDNVPACTRYLASPNASAQGISPKPRSSSSSTVWRTNSPRNGRNIGQTPLRQCSRPGKSTAYADPNHLRNRNDALALSVNKSIMADSFVKIYTDSFEHLLSCWVTSTACPYNSPFGRQAIRKLGINQDLQSYYNPQLRFHEMVCRLDSRLGSLDSTYNRRDAIAGRNALQKTVMAFASQWTPRNQPSRSRSRKSRRFNSVGSDSGSVFEMPVPCSGNGDGSILGSSDSFNRIVQDSLWHEAYRSVQALKNTQSFCAIFANIIFALTQAPTDLSRSRISASSLVDDTFTPGSMQPQSNRQAVSDMINDEAPPVCLEVALGQLYGWRRTLDQLDALNKKVVLAPHQESTRATMKPTQSDLESFSLLYWLGVMCDTTAAALANRPIIIADQDCRAPPSSRETSDVTPEDSPADSSIEASMTSEDMTVWRLELHQQKVEDGSSESFRWPCSLADAAMRLRSGTQVKVLLFRKVTELQSLINRRVPPATIHDAIHQALRVYDSFTATYGQFLSDCMRDHDNLPARFQSWYIILGAHWNLGVLLLADAIEAIEGPNSPESIPFSDQGSLVSRLRLSGACAVADLARASCSPATKSFSYHSIDQDFTFNDGAFLTEPWSAILVRALAFATVVFLDLIADMDHGTPGSTDSQLPEISFHLSNAEACIAGLHQLEPKSDSAHRLATELGARLDALAVTEEPEILPYEAFIPMDGGGLVAGSVNSSEDSDEYQEIQGLLGTMDQALLEPASGCFGQPDGLDSWTPLQGVGVQIV